MFRKLLDKFETLFTASENHRYEAYFAQSVDHADLERRSRYYESSHNPFAFYDHDDVRDWQHR
jgi:hypothetical protein